MRNNFLVHYVLTKLSFYLPFHAVISNGFWLIAESGLVKIVWTTSIRNEILFSQRKLFAFFKAVQPVFLACVYRAELKYYYCSYVSIKQDLFLRYNVNEKSLFSACIFMDQLFQYILCLLIQMINFSVKCKINLHIMLDIVCRKYLEHIWRYLIYVGFNKMTQHMS